MNWEPVLETVLAILAAYAVLLVCLAVYARRHPDVISLRDALRLGPDLLGLVRRLATDRSVPLRARVLLGLLAVYLVVPIDLVPDFLPVIGYADDVVVLAVVLRAAVRAAGPDALARHWRGSDAGLRAVRALAGVREPGIDGLGATDGADGRDGIHNIGGADRARRAHGAGRTDGTDGAGGTDEAEGTDGTDGTDAAGRNTA
ncbi:YkvA family protein [Arthrobacter pityocampae]|uniref:YkvA family protein n=1 Tax=Arthrobacter pityocampae TaxID=547334 RepID=UPI0037351083